MTEPLESLRAEVNELERRVDALQETMRHVISAIEGGNFSQKKPLDFSSIVGHIQHSR
ncbi:MAG TPA: hypothetical protein VMB47_11365 [Candidatus Aquilonibacter sp.]|nr:hypothetical protein [Candidatus Aquilonibacter sp.]